MVTAIRQTNPYAFQLDQEISAAQLPPLNPETENEDLQSFLTKHVTYQDTLLESLFTSLTHEYPAHSTIFKTFQTVLVGQLDFAQAKEKVVNEVHSV